MIEELIKQHSQLQEQTKMAISSVKLLLDQKEMVRLSLQRENKHNVQIGMVSPNKLRDLIM